MEAVKNQSLMKSVIVMEKDRAIQKELVAAVQEYDPKLKVVVIAGLRELIDYLMLQIDARKGGLPPDKGSVELDDTQLMILEAETLGKRTLPLLQKTQNFFKRHGLSSFQPGLKFVVTAFDYEKFSATSLNSPVVSNVVFKPFDKSILMQKVSIAFEGHKAFSSKYLYVQQADAEVEMLKNIQMVELSETGFTTQSEEIIPVGRIAKYYSPIFQTGQHLFAMGRCMGAEPSTKDPKVNLCRFHFFAASQEQMQSLRKLLQTTFANEKKALEPKRLPSKEKVQIVFVGEDSKIMLAVQESLKSTFLNYESISVKDFLELEKSLATDSSLQKMKALFAFDLEISANVKLVKEKIILNSPSILIYGVQKDPANNQAESMARLEIFDYLTKDYDRNLFLNLIFQSIPELQLSESRVKPKIGPFAMKLKVSRPVKVTAISEAGLVLSYNRQLPAEDLRTFYLKIPNVVQKPELIAKCIYSEKLDKALFSNYFSFFGLSDYYLKHIRSWMKAYYVSTKKEE